jgi:hypothetical protein
MRMCVDTIVTLQPHSLHAHPQAIIPTPTHTLTCFGETLLSVSFYQVFHSLIF